MKKAMNLLQSAWARLQQAFARGHGQQLLNAQPAPCQAVERSSRLQRVSRHLHRLFSATDVQVLQASDVESLGVEAPRSRATEHLV